MKLYFMKEDALTYFKGNIENNLESYSLKTNEWMFEKYAEPFEEFKIEVPDFTLSMADKNPANTDYENIKIIYENLKGISSSQATDERLWAGLAHTVFMDFLKYRIGLDNKKEISKEKILNNFFFKQNIKRSLIGNPLSRLWWAGKMVYDEENSQNPFYALEHFKTDFSTKSLMIFSNNYTGNPKILRAVLTAIEDLENEYGKLDRKRCMDIYKYVNILGGIIITDYLSQEELKEKIKNYYYKKYLKP